MTHRTLGVFAIVFAMAGVAPAAEAQGRGRSAPSANREARRAVPRTTAPRSVRPPVVLAPYRGYYYPPYRSGFGLGFYYGPGYYRYPYAYGYPAYGYPLYGYPPYGYGRWPYGLPAYAVRPYGGVRIDLPNRDAEVLVDGYYVGTVDDFDGAFQQLNLEPGPHRIEVRAPGFEPLAFETDVQPGRTITYRGELRPAQP